MRTYLVALALHCIFGAFCALLGLGAGIRLGQRSHRRELRFLQNQVRNLYLSIHPSAGRVEDSVEDSVEGKS